MNAPSSIPMPLLRPMSDAPRTDGPDKLLVMVEFTECGQQLRTWDLVDWQGPGASEGPGWYSSGRAVQPVGWVQELPGGPALMEVPANAERMGTAKLAFELRIDTDDDCLVSAPGQDGSPATTLLAVIRASNLTECRHKLQQLLKDLKVLELPHKAQKAQELRTRLAKLARVRAPEGFSEGGNIHVEYRAADIADLEL
jgi:hypothetical protein